MEEKTLNITNGDSAVDVMQRGGISGDFLPWRDVLHEGPVPANLSLQALSEVRASYIADCGWATLTEAKKNFAERDERLKAFRAYSKVILWFEHDLYDQLQILQILDWFSGQAQKNTTLTMICTDQYLGMIPPEKITDLWSYEKDITAAQLILATKAWAAFRESTPELWAALLNENTEILPFLNGAVLRLLEEYPSLKNGLSRTAQKALEIIGAGETCPIKIFKQYRETEERLFLGDWSFWRILNTLLDGENPLLHLKGGGLLSRPPEKDQILTISPLGKTVLHGEKHAPPQPDHWIGGVHLSANSFWMWDAKKKILQRKKPPLKKSMSL